MSYWVSGGSKFYIPPAPASRTLSTDEYVQRTDVFYHATSDRLLCVGHPYWTITDRQGRVTVQKVSPDQFRVFRVQFPDPNKFAYADPNFYNPDTERLVWAICGVEVSRGLPLGIAITGNPITNKQDDVENPQRSTTEPNKNRVNMGMDPKQTQLLIVGCKPADGEHWGRAIACQEDEADQRDGACPPIELKQSIIQDGDMMDIGFGAMDFSSLQANKSEVPLEISQGPCKYPDYIKMSKDKYGDSMFFFTRNEQQFMRHFLNRAGTQKEEIPAEFLVKTEEEAAGVPNTNYWGTPSGSLVSSGNQLFNRPYWIVQAQGHNNGILWENEAFVTVGDNTRGTIFNINVKNNGGEHYTPEEYNEYVRHAEEYDLAFVIQVCKVKLDPEIVTHLHQMNPRIFDNWNLGITTAQGTALGETYRYLETKATKCPDSVVPADQKKDPYEGYKFWRVDLSEKLSLELTEFPLGRKFLYQRRGINVTRKRPSVTVTSGKKTVKRRRKLQ